VCFCVQPGHLRASIWLVNLFGLYDANLAIVNIRRPFCAEQIDKGVRDSANDLEESLIGDTLIFSSTLVLWPRFKYQVGMIMCMSTQSVRYLLIANEGCSQ